MATRDKHSQSPQSLVSGTESTSSASVVLMAPASGGCLRKSIQSIRRQQASFGIEIIVVESAPGAASDLGPNPPNVKIARATRVLSPGETRNVGANLAEGDVVAFLAGDCIVEPGWLTSRMRLHEQGEAAVASAVTHAGPRTPWALGAHYLIFGHRHPALTSEQVQFPDPRGHGISLSKEVIGTVGPFSTNLLVGEDTEMYKRLSEAGHPVFFSSSVRVGHVGTWTVTTVVTDLYRRGYNRGEIEKSYDGVLWAREEKLLLLQSLRRLGSAARVLWNDRQLHWMTRVLSLPWLLVATAAYHFGWARSRRHSRDR